MTRIVLSRVQTSTEAPKTLTCRYQLLKYARFYQDPWMQFHRRREKKILDRPSIQIWPKNVMGAILGWDPPSIQDSWKSVQEFLWSPANKQTNHQPRNKRTRVQSIISLAVLITQHKITLRLNTTSSTPKNRGLNHEICIIMCYISCVYAVMCMRCCFFITSVFLLFFCR